MESQAVNNKIVFNLFAYFLFSFDNLYLRLCFCFLFIFFINFIINDDDDDDEKKQQEEGCQIMKQQRWRGDNFN